MISKKILNFILSQPAADSFYIVDLNKFRDNYRSFLSSFKKRYSNVNIGYSYKTNYMPSLCTIVREEGGYAEVVSDLEYAIARELGVKGERIIFNGPVKEQAALVKAIKEGALINIDSMYEFQLLKKIYQTESGLQPAHLGIRCNFPITGNEHSRFGIDIDSEDFNTICNGLRENPDFHLEGLHCHFSSATRSVASFGERTERLMHVTERVFTDSPKFIDIGGGFFGNLGEEFEKYFGFQAPGYEQYAEEITSKIRRKYPDEESELILEPGTAIVADVIWYICKVRDLKKIRGRRYAQTSGSVQTVKPTGNSKNVPFHVLRDGQLYKQEDLQNAHSLDIVGYTCMEHDVICKDINIDLEKGDFLIFSNMGSYSTVFKPPFIKGSAPIYAIQEEQSFITKAKETYKNFLDTYSF